jgi:hypothetical protein
MTLDAEPLHKSDPPTGWVNWELPPNWTYGSEKSLQEAFFYLKLMLSELKELEDCL